MLAFVIYLVKILNRSGLFDIIDNIKCVVHLQMASMRKELGKKTVRWLEIVSILKVVRLYTSTKSCIEFFYAHMHKHTQAPTYYQCASIVVFYRSDRWKWNWWRNELIGFGCQTSNRSVTYKSILYSIVVYKWEMHTKTCIKYRYKTVWFALIQQLKKMKMERKKKWEKKGNVCWKSK